MVEREQKQLTYRMKEKSIKHQKDNSSLPDVSLTLHALAVT